MPGRVTPALRCFHFPLILLLVGGTVQTLTAQAPRDVNALGWYAYIGEHALAAKWELNLEAQWRRSDVILGWQQFLFRPSLAYTVSERWSVAAGYTYARTYPYGAFPDPYASPEHRAFQQVSASHSTRRWELGHRFRLEQRFQGLLPDPPAPEVGRWRYQNRARYELSAKRPFSTSTYVLLAAEPSVRFGINYRGRVVDQIQIYTAIGRSIGNDWRLETGYSHQYGVPRTGHVFESNHTLQMRLHYCKSLVRTGKAAAALLR